MWRGQTLMGLFTSAVEVKEVATDPTHDPNLNQQYYDIMDGKNCKRTSRSSYLGSKQSGGNVTKQDGRLYERYSFTSYLAIVSPC